MARLVKRKKNSRLRGSHTHGWGAKKKHRGAGHRGGRGRAGSGKRGDAKKPSYWAIKKFYGKHGFKPVGRASDNVPTINISMIEDRLHTWVKQKVVTQEKDGYAVDLTKLGYAKLLSAGKTSKKLFVTVSAASQKAVEKIKAAGGDVSSKA